MRRRQDLLRWLPAVFCAAAIFAGSSITGPSADKLDIPFDKPIHLLEFAALGALLLRALSSGRRPVWGEVLLAVAIGISYGALDELHQGRVPGRSADLADLVADATGVLLGVGLWTLFSATSARPR